MTNTPKPQANTLDEIRGKLHLLYNGMTSNSKDADLILKTPVSDIVLQVEEQIQALITEARVDGRKDAIGCSSVIEQEWRAYRGSSSYLEVALETINQTQLKENK